MAQAGLAKLAYAPELGSGVRKDVGVQVSRPAPYNRYTKDALEAASQSCKTWSELCSYFGKRPESGALTYLKRRMKRYGIDASHLDKNNKYTQESLAEAVQQCYSWAEVCGHFGVDPLSGAQSHFIRRAIEFSINFDHFHGKGWSSNRQTKFNIKRNIWDYLVIDGPKINSQRLKERLIEEGIKRNECEWCGLTLWQGVPISLELDHINCSRRDARIENLQLLCPNCHSIKTSFDCGVRPLPEGWTVRGPQRSLTLVRVDPCV